MAANSGDVRLQRSPVDDAILVHSSRLGAGDIECLRLVRSSDGTGWTIYSPDGVPLVRFPREPQAIAFAARLVAAERIGR